MDIRNKNIVFIGMPGCGKTTIGKSLYEKLEKSYIDLDEEIIKLAKMSIPNIFSKFGEERFRDYESLVCEMVANKENYIISTGGGVIKKEKNMRNLSKNGIIIFIDRDLDKLISYDPNRPLSSSKEAVKKLYEERYTLYCKYADVIIKNNTTIEDCIEKILKYYQSI